MLVRCTTRCEQLLQRIELGWAGPVDVAVITNTQQLNQAIALGKGGMGGAGSVIAVRAVIAIVSHVACPGGVVCSKCSGAWQVWYVNEVVANMQARS